MNINQNMFSCDLAELVQELIINVSRSRKRDCSFINRMLLADRYFW